MIVIGLLTFAAIYMIFTLIMGPPSAYVPKGAWYGILLMKEASLMISLIVLLFTGLYVAWQDDKERIKCRN